MPHNLGRLLADECQVIDLSDILQKYRSQLKRAIIGTEFEILGITVALTTTDTPFGGTRLWFACPSCDSRARKLIINPVNLNLGCRKCLNVDYRKQRYKGMVESSQR